MPLIVGLLCVLLGFVCYTDIRYRIIGNKTVLAVGVLAAALGYTTLGNITVVPALYILVIGFLLSVFNIMGAGDSKLLAALSLSLSRDGTLFFLFITSLAGLPIALIILCVRLAALGKSQSTRKKSVPYGVAIGLGYLATVVLLRVSV
ncbi:Type IV prepilin peptidase [Paramixta manurensis]|uniref:Type IV prepilin peptidase n=1 Tax=Paramixta manurensis TaxID=2740817 RepID=A0A6M8UHS9_9GAMM|nr:Type IV prepilin peptidase [Erwiniaceae bacterium PD-1]